MEQAGIFDGLMVWVGLALMLTAIGAAYAVISHYSAAKECTTVRLLDPTAPGQVEREDIADALLQTHFGDRYLAVLEGGLAWLERNYGPRRGRYALVLSMALALAYSWVLFFVLWGFEVVEGDLQLPLGLALAIMPPALFYFFRWWTPRVMRWQARLEARWAEAGNRTAEWFLRGGICVLAGSAFLLEIYVRTGGIDAVAGAFDVAGAVAFAGAGAENRDGNRSQSISQFVWLTGFCAAAGLLFGLLGESEQATIFLAFMLVLPLANGVADYTSLWASRWFGGNLLTLAEAEDRRPGRLSLWIGLHMLGDLAVAAAALTGLTAIISFMMQGLSHIRGYGFDVLGEDSRAAANWSTDGLWLTLLLFSTLLPTLAHLMALLFAWISLRGPRQEIREAWAARLTSPAFDPGDTDDVRLVNSVAAWQSYSQGLWLSAISAIITVILIGGLGYALHATGIAPADGISWIAAQAVALADFLRGLVG